MDDVEEVVARIVRAAGGSVVGRIRLQKEVYLLEQLGLQSGFHFSYHYYGPYSAELTDAVDGARAFSYLTEDVQSRQSDGVPFSVYRVGPNAPSDHGNVGALPESAAASLLSTMQKYSATVLELAATIHWLKVKEAVADWKTELVRRKGSKTEMGRTDKALELLNELRLA